MNFTLTLPTNEELKQEITEQTALTVVETKAVATQTHTNVDAIFKVDIDSLAKRQEITRTIDNIGVETMKKSETSNQLTKTSIGKLSDTGSEGGKIAGDIAALQMRVKDLDPSGIDFLKKGLIGKASKVVAAYFKKFESADSVINKIVVSLENGKDMLVKDNTTLEIEQVKLRELTKVLQREIAMCEELDRQIDEQIPIAEADPEFDRDRLKFIKEEISYPLKRKIQDMQQVILVNYQGYMAMGVVLGNNKELIRGINTSRMVVVTALRYAVMLARALYDQKLVLDTLTDVNNTANAIIAGTAKMLNEQGTAIHEQAANSGISVDTFRQSFADMMSAVNALDTFKDNARGRMSATIQEFRQMADEAEGVVARMEKAKALTDGV